MSDAFDVLRRPDAPIAPSEAFARRLRRQLATELQPLLEPSASAPTRPTTERMVSMTVTPYLSVRDAAAALDFYREAFGAVETSRLLGDDGRVGHAEFTIGTSRMMIADEYPEVGSLGPQSRGGATCLFHLDVADVDESYARALRLGATSLREPADQFHGSRTASITDPFGHPWMLSTLVESLTTEQYAERAAAADDGFGSFTLETPEPGDAGPGHQVKHHDQGDLYYFTLPVADLARAQSFYGAVLGWQFTGPDHGHVENISAPPGGVNHRTDDTGARLWFVVDDIDAAVERVRSLGGTATDPVHSDSGWSSDCTDDQGTVFSLSVPTPEYTA